MTPGRRRRPLFWLAACLLVWAGTVHAAPLPFVLDQADLGAAEVEASRELFDTAWSRLPPAWAGSIDAPVHVQWRSDLPAHVHGRARGR